MKFNKVVSGLIIGGLLLTAGGITMASASETSAKISKMSCFRQDGQLHRGPAGMGQPGLGQPGLSNETMKDVLGQLVSDGTLTQEQVDKFQAYIDEALKSAEENAKNRQEKRADIFKDAVGKGIITQGQADIIISKVREKAQELRQEKMKTQLSTLVTGGTITQEQADKVLQDFNEAAAKRQENFEKIKDMTMEERQSYMQTLKAENKNPLSQLVTNGAITQGQADAIAKLMPHRGGQFKGKGLQNNIATE